MGNIRYRCSWGYSTEYFLAGAYGAHVNNISYLIKKNSIRSKDIRFILNKIGKDARKRYNYDLLESTYIEMLKSQIDDAEGKRKIKEYIGDRRVLILAPGNTIDSHIREIKQYIETHNPVIIAINFIREDIYPDFLYMSNKRRYQTLKEIDGFGKMKKIFTSNFTAEECDSNTIRVSFVNLVKCGWEFIDNSMLMLLRLLSDLEINNIVLAGFDGYETDSQKRNYFTNSMEIISIGQKAVKINEEIAEMLVDFNNTRRNKNMKIEFITPSRFKYLLE